MTPKERAIDLVNKMLDKQEYSDVYQERGIISWSAKQCALIAVNLLMEEADGHYDYDGFIAYWQEVKHEIEKL